MRRVFCIGLPKTGTSTFREAIKLLGYQKICGFDMSDCNRFLHGDIDFLIEKLHRYEAAHDWPWPLLYQSIFKAYPDALFILTRRKDEKAWFDSLQPHAEQKRKLVRPPGMRQHIFGYENPSDNVAHHIQFYREHIADVRRYFKHRGTLIELSWDSGDGWAGLCEALSLPAPDAPFPHANKRAN